MLTDRVVQGCLLADISWLYRIVLAALSSGASSDIGGRRHGSGSKDRGFGNGSSCNCSTIP